LINLTPRHVDAAISDTISRGLRRRLRIDTMPTRLSEVPSEPRIAGAIAGEKRACKA
jgi:hypothetical protein